MIHRRPTANRNAIVAVAVASTIVWFVGVASFLDAAPWRAMHAHPGHVHASAREAAGHEADEGSTLAPSDGETVSAGPHCPPGAPLRVYEVVAIDVEITLNRYSDHDPEGAMFVLAEDEERVRQEEAANRTARSGQEDPAVSVGLQGDAIQPLVLRVNQGECLTVRLRNALAAGAPASFHVHGSQLYLEETGAPALASDPDGYVRPGETVAYRWWVGDDHAEGTHMFHSHGNPRRQTGHGLFGAVVVEPAGSVHLDPRTGGETRSGWDAIIRSADGGSFREFVIIYHEIGNERYQHRDRRGKPVTLVDPLTDAYKPGGRAINYRSEPFMNRLALQRERTGSYDESLAYSSYAFGDPATPVARSYLGDPVKQRIVHGGSEVFHVHHVHGGSIRWRRQPGTEDTRFDSGPDKYPALLPSASERLDSQGVGPSESYDAENECGSGGCQGSAGDYLVHCHVAHHYFAGMWMIWRVYNTLQDGVVSQDELPALAELPDRIGGVAAAVTSAELIGTRVGDQGRVLGADDLADWVERRLPPQGRPKGYDASVFDWIREGDLYSNEPDSDEVWPGFASARPGERPPIRFDPRTGALAYPFLRPHLGARPPFAPGHGPSPFLEPNRPGSGPAPPGSNGATSLCPDGVLPQDFTIHAITLPITLNERLGLVDPAGQIFVLKEDEERVRAHDRLRVPLAIRANAGQHCVDIVFKSELVDTRDNAFLSKANIHIHFVQFDVQGSDGVTMGFNYEQSVRPFARAGEVVTERAAKGADRLLLTSSDRFSPGAWVGVGMDQSDTFEVRRIRAVEAGALVLDEALAFDHEPGEIVSSEFVRYRWYPDVQFGTAYFHDHVAALDSWRHGLYGALISEPPDSTYHDPRSGEVLKSGPIADIHTEGRASLDVAGAFRELVLFVHDDHPRARRGKSTGSTLNLRVEPPETRGESAATRLSSDTYGDPETPLFEAFAGDPLVIRGLAAATNDVHTLHVDGHPSRLEPFAAGSALVPTVHLGVSERVDLFLPRAGGPQTRAGDYLIRNGRASKLREGSWGILRVHENGVETDLRPLPGREAGVPGPDDVCPHGAPVVEFEVTALDLTLPMLNGSPGRVFVLADDIEELRAGGRVPEPLVLHVNVGDCLRVHLTNGLADGGAVSFHADMLVGEASTGLGVGRNPPAAVEPGARGTYTYYAHPEVGPTVALVHDGGDPLGNPRLGLYGAVVVGPVGATYTDPLTGEDVSGRSSWSVDVHPPDAASYRDFTLFLHDEDEVIGTAVMPYVEAVSGPVGINYRAEPWADRLATNGDPSTLFQPAVHGDPATPLLEARPGDPLAIHVLTPFSEQAHVFSLEGHTWPLEPNMAGTDMLSSVQVGALEAVTMHVRAGEAGDYLYGDHREPYREAGLWGYLRVHALDATGSPAMLPSRHASGVTRGAR